MKISNFAWIKIHILSMIGSLGYYKVNFTVYIFVELHADLKVCLHGGAPYGSKSKLKLGMAEHHTYYLVIKVDLGKVIQKLNPRKAFNT